MVNRSEAAAIMDPVKRYIVICVVMCLPGHRSRSQEFTDTSYVLPSHPLFVITFYVTIAFSFTVYHNADARMRTSTNSHPPTYFDALLLLYPKIGHAKTVCRQYFT